MTTQPRPEALIDDLAIVLAGSLHPSAEIGPAPRLAAHRLRDVLGIEDGAPVRTIEPLIAAALGGEPAPVHYRWPAVCGGDSPGDPWTRVLTG